MQLDSVRELKAALTQSLLAPLSAAAAPRAMALAAGEAGARGAHRSFALGVAKKGATDFKLAFRIQRPELQNSQALDVIKSQAKGEVDVRYIGRVQKRAKASRAG